MIRMTAVVGLALGGLLASCSSSDSGGDGQETFTVHGRLALIGEGAGAVGPCQASGGYSDINPGTQVTVEDASGKKLAVASLGKGESTGPSYVNCRFDILVPDVPAGDGLYVVQVGQRGERTYKQNDLETELGSALNLTLGSRS